MAKRSRNANIRRFYCPDLCQGANVLAGSEAHHALHVVRLREGEEVELFDGKGRSAQGCVESCRRSEMEIHVSSEPEKSPPPKPRLELAFAVPKGKRLDWLLEKACELGTTRLVPIRFSRSVAGGPGPGGSKRDRWEATCISAAKQCRSSWLCQIEQETPLETYLEQADGAGIFGCPEGAPLARSLDRTASKICLLIGPEGGLTRDEESLVRNRGFVPASLGSYILRTETAALALLSGVRALIPTPCPQGVENSQ
jgi:16S rRNA (uracil1498-N3)-methyltransferase